MFGSYARGWDQISSANVKDLGRRNRYYSYTAKCSATWVDVIDPSVEIMKMKILKLVTVGVTCLRILIAELP